MSLSFTKITPSNFSFVRHPISEAFEDLTGKDFEALTKDIQTRGLDQPILLWPDEQTIVDGWQRHRACDAAHAKKKFQLLEGEEPEVKRYVYAKNALRRGSTDRKRTLWLLRLGLITPSKSGEKGETPAGFDEGAIRSAGATVDEVAAMADTSKRTAEKAIAEYKEETGTKKERKTKTIKDCAGRVIPNEMVADWEYAQALVRACHRRFQEIVHLIDQERIKANEGTTKALNGIADFTLMDEVRGLEIQLKNKIEPSVLCIHCQGYGRDHCRTCWGRGFLTLDYCRTHVTDDEMKLAGANDKEEIPFE